MEMVSDHLLKVEFVTASVLHQEKQVYLYYDYEIDKLLYFVNWCRKACTKLNAVQMQQAHKLHLASLVDESKHYPDW